MINNTPLTEGHSYKNVQLFPAVYSRNNRNISNFTNQEDYINKGTCLPDCSYAVTLGHNHQLNFKIFLINYKITKAHHNTEYMTYIPLHIPPWMNNSNYKTKRHKILHPTNSSVRVCGCVAISAPSPLSNPPWPDSDNQGAENLLVDLTILVMCSVLYCVHRGRCVRY